MVPVLGRGDQDCINILPLEQLPMVKVAGSLGPRHSQAPRRGSPHKRHRQQPQSAPRRLKRSMWPRPIPPDPIMPITKRSLAPNTRALKEGCDKTPNPTAAVVRPRNFLRVTPLFSIANLHPLGLGRNFRFQLYLCAQSYASRPLVPSSHRHGSDGGESHLVLAVTMTSLVCSGSPTCLATNTWPPLHDLRALTSQSLLVR